MKVLTPLYGEKALEIGLSGGVFCRKLTLNQLQIVADVAHRS